VDIQRRAEEAGLCTTTGDGHPTWRNLLAEMLHKAKQYEEDNDEPCWFTSRELSHFKHAGGEED
jgi:hypothetical protein